MTEKYQHLKSGRWEASQDGTRWVPVREYSDEGASCAGIVFVLGILVGLALYLALF